MTKVYEITLGAIKQAYNEVPESDYQLLASLGEAIVGLSRHNVAIVVNGRGTIFLSDKLSGRVYPLDEALKTLDRLGVYEELKEKMKEIESR